MFKNAYSGIKKIYSGEVLGLIGAILALIAAVLSVLNLSSGAKEGLLITLGLLIIFDGIILIVAFFLNIIGVIRASMDESAFKNALYALLAGIAASILVSAFSNNQLISGIGNTINNFANMLSSYFICTGIINLADKLNDSATSARGEKVRSLLLGLWMLSAILSIAVALMKENTSMVTFMAVVAIISGIASIVAYFLYIGLLGKARKMLAC